MPHHSHPIRTISQRNTQTRGIVGALPKTTVCPADVEWRTELAIPTHPFLSGALLVIGNYSGIWPRAYSAKGAPVLATAPPCVLTTRLRKHIILQNLFRQFLVRQSSDIGLIAHMTRLWRNQFARLNKKRRCYHLVPLAPARPSFPGQSSTVDMEQTVLIYRCR